MRSGQTNIVYTGARAVHVLSRAAADVSTHDAFFSEDDFSRLLPFLHVCITLHYACRMHVTFLNGENRLGLKISITFICITFSIITAHYALSFMYTVFVIIVRRESADLPWLCF